MALYIFKIKINIVGMGKQPAVYGMAVFWNGDDFTG